MPSLSECMTLSEYTMDAALQGNNTYSQQCIKYLRIYNIFTTYLPYTRNIFLTVQEPVNYHKLTYLTPTLALHLSSLFSSLYYPLELYHIKRISKYLTYDLFVRQLND